MKTLLLTTLTAAALVACASQPAQPGPASTPAEPEAHEHQWPMPEMEAMHDVLAPAWHGAVEKDKDPAEACAAVPDLKAAAAKLTTAEVPADKGVDQATFAEKAAAVEAAIATFEGQCAGEGPADLKAAFTPIHDAFHRVMELFAVH